MSRDMALTRPSQRSVRTGPGFTATNEMPCLPYWPASAFVRFCPAALAAPGSTAALLDHDRKRISEASHIAHELQLQGLIPMVLCEGFDHASGRGSRVVDHD